MGMPTSYARTASSSDAYGDSLRASVRCVDGIKAVVNGMERPFSAPRSPRRSSPIPRSTPTYSRTTIRSFSLSTSACTR